MNESDCSIDDANFEATISHSSSSSTESSESLDCTNSMHGEANPRYEFLHYCGIHCMHFIILSCIGLLFIMKWCIFSFINTQYSFLVIFKESSKQINYIDV